MSIGGLRRKFQNIANGIARAERAHAQQMLLLSDLRNICDGGFLVTIKTFEAYIEDLLLSYACGQQTWQATPRSASLPSRPIFKEDRKERIRDIALAGKKYIDVFPYDRFVILAKRLVSDGRPFSDLPKAQAKILNEVIVVRNHIAHDSGHSERLFRKEILENYSMPPWRRTAADYLLASHSVTQRKYEYYQAALILMAKFLSPVS